MNILFIVAQSSEGHSQTLEHRFIPVADELRDRGHDCRIFEGRRRTILNREFTHIGFDVFLHLFSDLSEYDVVILNASASPLVLCCLHLCNLKGVPFIYDIDDALHEQQQIVGTPFSNPMTMCLRKILSNATYVTVGSEYLANFISEYTDHFSVLRTPVNTNIYNPTRYCYGYDHDGIVIGWMGSGPVHHENLRILREPLEELSTEYNIQFRIISSLGEAEIHDTFSNISGLTVDFGFDDWVSQKKVANEMQSFDIAALPLDDSVEFMKNKSIIKVLEHMSMNLPVVASDSPPYNGVIKDGKNGLLASSAEEWKNKLEILILDEQMRYDMAEESRRTKEAYTIKAYTSRLESILQGVQ